MNIKILTVCSDSHKELLEKHFIPSLPSTLIPEIIIIDQYGNGNHGQHPEFIQSMREKIQAIIDFIIKEKNSFIYCDADVRFNPLLDPVSFLSDINMKNKFDIICQRDGNDICCGFMFINSSEKTLNYFKYILEYMKANPSLCDQLAFKEIYHSKQHLLEMKPLLKFLDIYDGFGNMNHLQPNQLWESDNDILYKHKNLIKKQFMWHANHTIGVNNKMRMLNQFQEICEYNN